MEKPNVVVVGGGTAGIAAAQALHEATNVTLVDSSPYMEIHWSGLRSMVEPETVQKLGSLVDYDSIPRIGKFVQGVVKAMTDEVVILESGKQLVFDYAVLCMGSSYSDETIVKKRVGSKAERMEQFTGRVLTGEFVNLPLYWVLHTVHVYSPSVCSAKQYTCVI